MREYHLDNLPSYYSTSAMRNYKAVLVDVLAREHMGCTDLDDMCEPDETRLLVKIKRLDGAQDCRDMVSTIAKGFTPPSCGCAHDCCGHRHGWAEVNLLTPDMAYVTIRTQRNY